MFANSLSLVSGIRQQCDISRPLYCFGKHALMDGAVARNATRQNLATLRNKVPQKPGILEINDVHLLDAEAAYSATTKPASSATASALRRTTPVEIIVAVVAPPSIFIIC